MLADTEEQTFKVRETKLLFLQISAHILNEFSRPRPGKDFIDSGNQRFPKFPGKRTKKKKTSPTISRHSYWSKDRHLLSSFSSERCCHCLKGRNETMIPSGREKEKALGNAKSDV